MARGGHSVACGRGAQVTQGQSGTQEVTQVLALRCPRVSLKCPEVSQGSFRCQEGHSGARGGVQGGHSGVRGSPKLSHLSFIFSSFTSSAFRWAGACGGTGGRE